jgi:hypothetical protein
MEEKYLYGPLDDSALVSWPDRHAARRKRRSTTINTTAAAA